VEAIGVVGGVALVEVDSELSIPRDVDDHGPVVVHPSGIPIIHSTNDGLRRTVPGPALGASGGEGGESLADAVAEVLARLGVSRPRTTTSVSVAPECRPSSRVAQLPATPLAAESRAVGVGNDRRCCSRASSVGSWFSNPDPLWSLATGVGRRPPRATARSSVACRNDTRPPDRSVWLSRVAIGVGRRCAHSIRFGPSCLDPRLRPPWREFDAVGVGIAANSPLRAIVVRLGVRALGRSFSPPRPLIPFCDESYSAAVGVGSEQVEAVARVRGADGGRRDTVPLRIPPALRQVPEDFLEGPAIADG
jgi:hypothetical protein